MTHSLKKNTLYNVLLNITSVIFPLITAPYISRVLEPDGVGLFNFATTYAGYFALVALLGIPTYGVREVSKARNDKNALKTLVSQLMSIAAITTIIVSFIYVLTILVIGQFSENYVIFLFAGFLIYLAPFKINWYYQGIEEFGTITKVALTIRTLSVISLFAFVKEKDDLVIYVIISVFGGVIADLWNYARMWLSGIRPKLTLKGLRPHLNPLFVLFISSIAISIYTVLDTLMLGFITDYDEVGYYTNAMHISRVILSAVTSISLVAVPRVAYYMSIRDYDNINVLISKSFSVVSFLAFPIAVGLSCVSPTFIPLFFGAKFVGSVIPMIILSFLIVIIGFNNLTGMQILIGMGYDKLFLYSMLVGTISNFILNCALIPILGAVGASVSSVVAELLVLLVSGLMVYKKTLVRIEMWTVMLQNFIGAIALIPLLFLLKQFFDAWNLIIVFVICGALMYLIIESLFKCSTISLLLSLINRKNNNSI